MMINYYISFGLSLIFLGKSCDAPVRDVGMDLMAAPVLSKDAPFANVYKILDGSWMGTFFIYEDERGQMKGSVDEERIDRAYLQQLPLREVGRVSVKQSYVSVSPYYQKVEIEDTYLENGVQKIMKSHGVNKIQDGVMWCVVQKPEEKVVHRGSTEGDHTIIWGRRVKDPLNIEYFRETVKSDTYEIVGYGYYGQDNPDLTPKTWFHGTYQRQD